MNRGMFLAAALVLVLACANKPSGWSKTDVGTGTGGLDVQILGDPSDTEITRVPCIALMMVGYIDAAGNAQMLTEADLRGPTTGHITIVIDDLTGLTCSDSRASSGRIVDGHGNDYECREGTLRKVDTHAKD